MNKLIYFCAFLFVSMPLFAQVSTLSGIILNAQQLPVSGASVQLLNTQFSTVTKHDGSFIMEKIPAGSYELYVESSGYASINKPIHLGKGNNNFEIVVHPSFKQLDEVIISTQKQDELQQKAALSVTTLQASQVESYSLWNTNDLTTIAPNLYSADPGDKRSVTSIRGLVSTSYDPAIATYVDGVNQFGLDTYIGQLFDIERIEIARGPQGTLYGRNAMGGVINIISKQPQNKRSGFVEATVGNWGQQRATAGIRLPLVNNRLFFGAAALFEKEAGFYTNNFDNSRYDQQHSIVGNYFLKYSSKTPWGFVLNVKHAANRNNGAFPLVFGIEEAFKNPYVLNQNKVTKMVDNVFNASLSFNHTGRLVNFSSQSAYQSNYRYYKSAIDADFSPLDGISVFNNYGKDWNKVKVWTQEITFSPGASINKKINWKAGTYLFYQHSPTKQATLFGADAPLLDVPDKDFSIINTTTSNAKGGALYAQADYKLTQNWKFIIGARYDFEKREQSILGEYQKDPDPNPAFAFQPDTSATATFTAFSPKIGFAFYPSLTNTLFVTFSKGFRAGGFTPLSSDPSQPPLYPFRPEKSNAFEAGSKNTFFNNKLVVNLSLFYSKVTDVQVATLVLPDAVTITKNTGKLTSKGVELEARTVLNGFEAEYSFGFTNAKYDNLKIAQNGSETNKKGAHQVFTPDVTSMLAAQYSFAFNKMGTAKLLLRSEWRFLGKQYFDLDNSIIQNPYSVINAKAGIIGKSLSFLLWARNLNSAEYISFAYDFGAVHLGNPKTIGATIAARF